MKCWCGAKGTAEQLYSEVGLQSECSGTGVLYCFCGGDQCVCHYHGETECDGCEYCEPEADQYGDPDDFDEFGGDDGRS